MSGPNEDAGAARGVPTVLVVDDEPPARRRLRDLLETDERVAVVGEAGDGLGAVREIERLRPDIVLLDIQMPELDGFEVLEALDTEPPRVVFVTAFDEFAIRAFEVRALDYLVKPADPERLREAIGRALDALAGAGESTGTPRADLPVRRPLSRFLVRVGQKMLLVAADDVDWIGAADNYAELHAGGRTHLVRGTLSALERRLDPDRFVRVHRSTIVNLEAVRAFEPWSHGDWLIRMRDGEELRLSRRYRDRLEGLIAP
ncbi:MAG: LytTR family DNA-binding domain-containing protein [Gemmatimonadota bacterium]